MESRTFFNLYVASLIGSFVFFLTPSALNAHCDTMNGPVVTAAKNALATGNVNLVLIWVQKDDEAAIRTAFKKTVAVRALGDEARNLADMYFYETLVRIHRAGEGVPYTGLKSAETAVDPGIAAADYALETGSSEELLSHLEEMLHSGIHGQFQQSVEKKNFSADDIEAGREYVEAYVRFIHYVERIHQAVSLPTAGHLHEAEE